MCCVAGAVECECEARKKNPTHTRQSKRLFCLQLQFPRSFLFSSLHCVAFCCWSKTNVFFLNKLLHTARIVRYRFEFDVECVYVSVCMSLCVCVCVCMLYECVLVYRIFFMLFSSILFCNFVHVLRPRVCVCVLRELLSVSCCATLIHKSCRPSRRRRRRRCL